MRERARNGDASRLAPSRRIRLLVRSDGAAIFPRRARQFMPADADSGGKGKLRALLGVMDHPHFQDRMQVRLIQESAHPDQHVDSIRSLVRRSRWPLGGEAATGARSGRDACAEMLDRLPQATGADAINSMNQLSETALAESHAARSCFSIQSALGWQCQRINVPARSPAWALRQSDSRDCSAGDFRVAAAARLGVIPRSSHRASQQRSNRVLIASPDRRGPTGRETPFWAIWTALSSAQPDTTVQSMYGAVQTVYLANG
jgi:hypothetical protein